MIIIFSHFTQPFIFSFLRKTDSIYCYSFNDLLLEPVERHFHNMWFRGNKHLPQFHGLTEQAAPNPMKVVKVWPNCQASESEVKIIVKIAVGLSELTFLNDLFWDLK